MSNFLKIIQEATPTQRDTKPTGGFFKRLAQGIESIERIGTGKWYDKSSKVAAPKKGRVSQRDNVIKNVKPGDVVALTLSTDSDNVARVVRIIKVRGDRLTVNDTRKKKSSNYTILIKNIKDINYFGAKSR